MLIMGKIIVVYSKPYNSEQETSLKVAEKSLQSKKADYILYYEGNVPIAIIEAKNNNHAHPNAGGSQGRLYDELCRRHCFFSREDFRIAERDGTKFHYHRYYRLLRPHFVPSARSASSKVRRLRESYSGYCRIHSNPARDECLCHWPNHCFPKSVYCESQSEMGCQKENRSESNLER